MTVTVQWNAGTTCPAFAPRRQQRVFAEGTTIGEALASVGTAECGCHNSRDPARYRIRVNNQPVVADYPLQSGDCVTALLLRTHCCEAAWQRRLSEEVRRQQRLADPDLEMFDRLDDAYYGR